MFNQNEKNNEGSEIILLAPEELRLDFLQEKKIIQDR
jgi:hypothetical protein